MTRAELIKALRKDTALQHLLQLPARIHDTEREIFEDAFQGMDYDDNREVDLEEFTEYVHIVEEKVRASKQMVPHGRPGAEEDYARAPPAEHEHAAAPEFKAARVKLILMRFLVGVPHDTPMREVSPELIPIMLEQIRTAEEAQRERDAAMQRAREYTEEKEQLATIEAMQLGLDYKKPSARLHDQQEDVWESAMRTIEGTRGEGRSPRQFWYLQPGRRSRDAAKRALRMEKEINEMKARTRLSRAARPSAPRAVEQVCNEHPIYPRSHACLACKALTYTFLCAGPVRCN